MSVSDIMQTDVVTVNRDAGIDEVADKLGSEEVGSVVVVEDDEPVGVVTDRSIALAVAEGDVSSRTAEDVMSEDVITIEQDAEAVDIARKMGEEKVRRLPVVDDGSLAGIVTLDDVVATIGEQMDDVADVIEAQSPDYEP